MNILYLINYAGAGGSEKYVKLLAEAYIDRPGTDNKVFFMYNVEGALSGEMKKRNIPIEHIVMKHPLDIKAAVAVAKYSKLHKIDVIHCQYSRENFIAILSKLFYRKTRVVYTSHLIVTNNLFWRILNRIMSPFNSAVIAVCNLGARLLAENGYCKDRIVVVYNGVEPVCTGGASRARGNVARSGGIWDEIYIPPNRFMFSALARLMSVKGLFFLMDAVKLLSETTDVDFGVLIAGDGELKGELADYIRQKGLEDRVILAGHRTDTKEILEGSDAYLNSSESEALSFAILEAMSYGLPVVATNVGGTPDIVNEKTKPGLMAEYGDVASYAAAMKRIMTDNAFYEECSANALKAVEEIFNINETIEKTFALYYFSQRKSSVHDSSAE